MGAACDPVLSPRPDPDVPAGVPGAAAADLRRLFHGRHPGLDFALRAGHPAPRHPARPVDHPGRRRRLGAVDARHDGHNHGRGLRGIFGYPGIGTLLFQAIRENDHFLIQGIVFTVIVSLGLATLILDLFYPLLDPRIPSRYRRDLR
ncbi:MAG: ABC transporter permease subunit [Devosia sp.]|nr:ABC transporter permease subunit [Devosia sp.]